MTLRDEVRSRGIHKTLNVETLQRRDRSQLRWFGHVTRMSQKILARQVLLAVSEGKRPRGRPSTTWRDYISDLTWSRLGVEPAELSHVPENHEVF